MLGYIKILRPINCFFAMFTTFIGVWYLSFYFSSDASWLPVVFVCLSTFFIAAAGYTINDYYDYEIDRINQPNRVLPRGEISLVNARIYSITLFITGLVLATLTKNIYCIVISILNSTTLYLYARYFKKSFLFGNLLVAWNSCSTFIFGALISSNIKNIMNLVCYSFLYTIIREWVKTIEDYEGDLKEKARTIAIICGKKNTMKLLFIPALALLLSVNLFNYNSFVMLFVLNLLITLPVIIFILILNDKNITKIQKLMKLNMIFIVLFSVMFKSM